MTFFGARKWNHQKIIQSICSKNQPFIFWILNHQLIFFIHQKIIKQISALSFTLLWRFVMQLHQHDMDRLSNYSPPKKTLNRILQGINFSIENSVLNLVGWYPPFYHFQKSHLPQKICEKRRRRRASPSNIIDATAAHNGSEAANNATSEPLTRRNASLANHMVSTSQTEGLNIQQCHGCVGRCRFLPKLLRDDCFLPWHSFCAFSSTRCLFPASCLCL